MSAPIDESPENRQVQGSQGTKRSLSAENSQEKLETRLDHGIKESFPGSDPVSVVVSKYAPGDAPGDGSDEGDHLSDEAYQPARDVADAVSEKVKGTVEGVSDQARKFTPKVAGQIRKQRNFIKKNASAHPVATAIMAGLVGCGIALSAYETLLWNRKRRKKTSPPSRAW